MEIHTILVPVDFSSCSFEAYRAALTLAQQFGGQLFILHVIDSRLIETLEEVQGGKPDTMLKALRKRARLQFRSFLSKHPTRIKVHRILLTGIPFQEIVKTARIEHVDLIVMGRYGGMGEVEKIFFGSTTEKVIRVAPCAVLSIPLSTPVSRRHSA